MTDHAQSGPQIVSSGRRGLRLQPSQLQREDYFWGSVYHGTGEQIVAAGLLTAAQLPGAPGIPYSGVTYGMDVRSQELVRLDKDTACLSRSRAMLRTRVRRRGVDCFDVSVQLSAEAREKREAHLEQARALQEERKRAAAALAAMPSCAAHFRSNMIRLAEVVEALVVGCMAESESHGYSFSRDTINDFEIAAGALRSILETGTVEFDSRRHVQLVAALRAAPARADSTLQLLLANATVQALCGSKV